MVGATTIVAASGALVLTAFSWWALAAIPRSSHEFSYVNPSDGNAFWPLPFAPLNGFTPEQLSSHLTRLLFLLPACVLAGLALRPRRLELPTLRLPAIVAIGCVLATGIHLFLTRGVPLQDDEATYVMQAALLANGQLADGITPREAAFAEPFTLFTPDGMTGMYPPGAPAILAAGGRFGVPWAGQLGMVALTLWCAFRAASRTATPAAASLGALLLAASPMFAFTSAGFMSQVPALAGLAVCIWGCVRGGYSGGAIAGTGLGLMLVTRPQAALPVGAALLLLYGRQDARLLIAVALAALPWAAVLALDNQAMTGRFYELRRTLYEGELERYGFGRVLRDYSHTPGKAAVLAGVALVRLNAWALGWPLSLAGPVLWLLHGRPYEAMVRPWGAAAAATILFQAGYCSLGTSETGPLYHYMALPFIAFSTAAVLRQALDCGELHSRQIGATAMACLALGTSSFYVEQGARLTRLTHAIEGPRRTIAAATPTLVLEATSLDRPQQGWVFGIPFRERSESAPVVRFPRPTRAAQREYLMTRFAARECRYLWFDWAADTYRFSDCAEIDSHNHVLDERGQAEWNARAGFDSKGRPWFEDGGWRRAFPYLPAPHPRP